YVAIRLHYWLPVVCCPPGSTMGVEECHAPLVTTLADGWHTGCDASTHSGGSRGKRHDSLGVWRRRWRFFPLARVGARVSPAEGKAKACSSTAAPRDRVCPWRTGPPRPRETSGRRGSPYLMRSRSARATAAGRANASRALRLIKARMPKRS